MALKICCMMQLSHSIQCRTDLWVQIVTADKSSHFPPGIVSKQCYNKIPFHSSARFLCHSSFEYIFYIPQFSANRNYIIHVVRFCLFLYTLLISQVSTNIWSFKGTETNQIRICLGENVLQMQDLCKHDIEEVIINNNQVI